MRRAELIPKEERLQCFRLKFSARPLVVCPYRSHTALVGRLERVQKKGNLKYENIK